MNDASWSDAVGAEPAVAVQYAPAGRRDALLAVWQLDARLRRIFGSAREPALAEIKLAWWQERLNALRTDVVPSEPLLRRLAGATAVTPADLAMLAEGWRVLFAEDLSAEHLGDHARLRGRALVSISAAALAGCATECMLQAGEGYALVDFAADQPNDGVRDLAMRAARDRFGQAGRIAWPRPMRPLGMIVELARGDAMRGTPARRGSPLRVARMVWHALSGR